MKENNSHGQMTAQIDLGSISKNGFNLDHSVYGTGRIGRLIPIHYSEVNAGDTMDIDSSIGVQFEPLAVPTLNNMHVKQEQFYVPKNVVWQNWDKFLSSGEDLQYEGKEPCFSLRECAYYLSLYYNAEVGGSVGYQFSLPFDVETGSIGIGSENDKKVFLTNDLVNRLENWDFTKTTFYSFLKEQGADDLLDNIPEAMRMLYEYIVSINSQESKLFLIGVYEDASGYTDEPEAIAEYEAFVDGNKYLRNLKRVLGVGEYRNKNASGMYIVVTEEFITIMRYMYECIRPILGLGSYLDMFEYNFLTFEDYLAIQIFTLVYSVAPSTSDTNPNVVGYVRFGLSEYGGKGSMYYLSTVGQSVLPLRAMYSIWYNNYRDQLIETSAPEPYVGDSGASNLIIMLLPRLRCWQKDTFTTALESAGTGFGVVPLVSNGNSPLSASVSKNLPPFNSGNTFIEAQRNDLGVYSINIVGNELRIPNGYISGLLDSDTSSSTDASYFSLSMLDAAKRAQKFVQKALYFGNRIQDFMYIHFGVKHLDARLRLPELLSAESNMVKLNVVTNNTTIASEGTIAGDRSAVAYGENYGNHIHRYCEEHGFIIGIMSIIPDISYSGGVSREHFRLDIFDYPFPEFSTLGMDAVFDVEMCKRSVFEEPDAQCASVFGYQGRYYDRKARLSREHGELLDTQDMYTFSRRFNVFNEDEMPKLNVRFVQCHPSLDLFVVDNELSDYFRFDVYNKVRGDLQLPLYSIYL